MSSFFFLIFSIILLNTIKCEDQDSKNWWKTAVLYQIYPRSFLDSNGDGIGDLNGIKSKLDYIKYLGVHGTWLSPVYKSPMKDFGYDVSDYTAIDPIFGTMEDFDDYVKKSKEKSLKVIMDFVPNHSSDEHEWFKKSERKEDPYTDYYVWVDGKDSPTGPQPPNNWQGVFGGSAWTWSLIRKQYYLHQFLKEQPDLNLTNSLVREELKNALRFWLDKGVDGFRIDAINHLFEDPLLRDEPPLPGSTAKPGEFRYYNHIYTFNLPEIHDVVREWKEVFQEYEDRDGQHRLLMVESALNITLSLPYFGNDTHPLVDMPFNFELFPIIKKSVTGLEVYKAVWGWLEHLPETKWSNWIIGNHDCNRVANRSHEGLIDAFNVILLLLKGTPITYYGEEIGMVDNFIAWDEIQDPYGSWFGPDEYTKYNRDPERTPMQWDDSKFAGFTNGNESWLPVNENYVYRNVEKQKSEPRSYLNVYRKTVTLKKEEAIINGSIYFPIITEDIFSFTRTLKNYPGYVVIVNFGANTEIVDLVEIQTEKFRFPKQGNLEIMSDKIWPSIVDLPSFKIKLNQIELPSQQVVVIKFDPIWL